MTGPGVGSDEREAAFGRSIDEFRRQIEADPLLPSAELCRRLDALADDVLALFFRPDEDGATGT